QAGVRLGNVGPGEVADLEAVAGRPEVDLEHFDIVAVEPDDRLVADNVHIGGDDLAEDRRFGPAQVGLPGLHAGFGRLHRIAYRTAGIDRHAKLDLRIESPVGRGEAVGALLDELGIGSAAVDRR